MAASDEEVKERCMELIKKKRERLKRCIYQSKKKVMNSLVGRLMRM